MARRRKGLRRKVPRHPNIEKAGSVFYVRIRMGGERLTIPCGPHFRDAEVVLANKLAERRHARLRRAGMASDDFPLASLWERYVAHCEDVLPAATVRGYREAGARWQKYLAADLLVSGLSREHAKGLVAWARGRGLSARSINLTLTVLRAALAFGVREGVIASHPLEHVQSVRRAEREPQTFTDEEARQLLDHEHPATGRPKGRAVRSWTDSTRPCESGDLWLLMYELGLRVLEATHLLWRHVDLAGRVLLVRSAAGHQLKTGASRRDLHVISESLYDMLCIRREVAASGPDDLVFPTRAGTVISRHSVARRLGVCMSACGIESAGRTPRSWRHTWVTGCVRAGIAPKQIQALAGWSSLKMLDRYTHLDASDNRRSLERLVAARLVAAIDKRTAVE